MVAAVHMANVSSSIIVDDNCNFDASRNASTDIDESDDEAGTHIAPTLHRPRSTRPR